MTTPMSPDDVPGTSREADSRTTSGVDEHTTVEWRSAPDRDRFGQLVRLLTDPAEDD